MPDSESAKSTPERPHMKRATPIGRTAVPRWRNQLVAVLLVSVIASVFVVAVTLVIVLHYAETHHALAAL
jgi:hypothetical protein